jgi:hypothetical protein
MAFKVTLVPFFVRVGVRTERGGGGVHTFDSTSGAARFLVKRAGISCLVR